MFRPREQKTTCPKCKKECPYSEDNVVPWGETYVVESWSGNCLEHGEFGQQGSSEIIFFEDVVLERRQSNFLKLALYHGFKSVEELEREIVNNKQ